MLKDAWQHILLVCGREFWGFLAYILDIKELSSWRPLPESKAVGMLAALPQKTLRHVDTTPDLVMSLPAMLLSNASNAVIAFSYKKGVTYRCQTAAKHAAVRAARQLALKLLGFLALRMTSRCIIVAHYMLKSCCARTSVSVVKCFNSALRRTIVYERSERFLYRMYSVEPSAIYRSRWTKLLIYHMGPMFEHCVAGKPEMTACAFVICAVFLLEPLLVLAQI